MFVLMIIEYSWQKPTQAINVILVIYHVYVLFIVCYSHYYDLLFLLLRISLSAWSVWLMILNLILMYHYNIVLL